MKKTIYIDHCATTPLAVEVTKVIHDYLNNETFGNPSASHHHIGKAALDVIENSRASIAKHFDVKPEDIYFCGSAVEASNIAIFGFAKRYAGRKFQILHCPTEHKAVLYPCQELSSSSLKVNGSGMLDLNDLESKLRASSGTPTLVCVMNMNNEIPVRYQVEDIGKMCEKYNAYFHCDAVQGVVRENLSASKILYSSLIFSGHKIYGPKGIGVLVLPSSSRALPISPLILGGDQEKSIRPGTHNVMGILGIAKAMDVLSSKREKLNKHMRDCDVAFAKVMEKNCKRFHLTVPLNEKYPGIVNFWIDGVNALVLLKELPHICINRGAACLGAGGEKISHVPAALGLPVEIGSNVLRASFGSACSVDEVVSAAEQISEFANKI